MSISATFPCGILFNLKKEGDLDICNTINELGAHYAKCSNPDTERQIPHDLIYTWNLKESNS